MHRYHILDAILFAAVIAMVGTCFRAAFSAGMALLAICVCSAYLGFKTAFVQLRREVERNKEGR